jgi:hypothetical protein
VILQQDMFLCPVLHIVLETSPRSIAHRAARPSR